jgi:hypothetical protein
MSGSCAQRYGSRSRGTCGSSSGSVTVRNEKHKRDTSHVLVSIKGMYGLMLLGVIDRKQVAHQLACVCRFVY